MSLLLVVCQLLGSEPPNQAEALASRTDLWGEAALREPGGPSYEFFEKLLPPPRYVNADFKYYPLVLSAPGSPTKARLISDGSGVNLRGGSRSWHDIGTPVTFRVGADEFRFGGIHERLSDPSPAAGWLPIYTITYRHPSPVQAEGLVPIGQPAPPREPEVYSLEAFASTDPALAEHGVVFVRFALAAGASGIITVQTDPLASGRFAAQEIRDSHDQPIVVLDPTWKWERGDAHAALRAGRAATLAIATRPLPAGKLVMSAPLYAEQRTHAENTWQNLIGRALQLQLPEERVQNAWKNLLAQNFMLLSGDRIFYSAGNQYQQLYEAEGSDAALAMLAFGYEAEARRMLVPLLDFTRKGLENHQASLKLMDVARCWWQTRDADWVRAMRPRWERELRRLLDGRSPETGLLPKERYCGDIATPVHSLSVEAKAWRALHDMPPVLRAIGDHALAGQVAEHAAQLRPRLLKIIERSIRKETTPPFIPMALLDHELVHDPITATRIGSYWNLMSNYVIGARLFPPGSEQETWLPRYLETHGGLCLGMTRSGGTAHAFWTGAERVNPLYGTRYVLDLLRRDEPDRALVSFYGMLAQGFTRDTLIAGEGCTLLPVDEGGRFFYCPPNSAGNAHFLTMLRHVLVQDLDLDDNGEPETLRLLFATPRRWLESGREIAIDHAPTAFGPVSLRIRSQLAEGVVTAHVELPSRNPPERTLLRARLPEGWTVKGARSGGKSWPADEHGTVDLTGLTGPIDLELTCRQQ